MRRINMPRSVPRYRTQSLRGFSMFALTLLLLAACGTQSKPQPTSSHTGGGSSLASNALPVSQEKDIVFDGDGLHVEGLINCAQYDVLASNRLTYDAGEIRAIR